MKNGDIIKRITSNPKVHHGQPCVRGTRTPVYVVLEALALGMNKAKIRAEYPPLTDLDIKACLMYAAMLAQEENLPLTK